MHFISSTSLFYYFFLILSPLSFTSHLLPHLVTNSSTSVSLLFPLYRSLLTLHLFYFSLLLHFPYSFYLSFTIYFPPLHFIFLTSVSLLFPLPRLPVTFISSFSFFTVSLLPRLSLSPLTYYLIYFLSLLLHFPYSFPSLSRLLLSTSSFSFPPLL